MEQYQSQSISSLGFSYKENKEKVPNSSRQQSESFVSDEDKQISTESDQINYVDKNECDSPNEVKNDHEDFKNSTASLIMTLNKTVLNSDPLPISSTKKNPIEKINKQKIEEKIVVKKIKNSKISENNSNNHFENSLKDSEYDLHDNIGNYHDRNSKSDSSHKSNNVLLDDKDQYVQMLEKEIESMKNIHDNLEDVFQSKISTFIERIIELEDGQEMVQIQHEEQIINFLKASGIYSKSGYDKNNFVNNNDIWIDLFRRQLDDERIKIHTLKSCLMRFSDKLTKADNNMLLDAGIILVASDSSDC